jgi:hypothetical protein
VPGGGVEEARSRFLKRAAVLFAILTIAATWPQIVRPAGIPDHRDSWFNMWRIAWIAHQLPRDPAHLFDANIHYPEPGTLAYSDAVLVPATIGAPLLWLGVPTPYVHTFLVLASFVFAGVGTWALVRMVTGSSIAGVAAGLIFAFTPYRFDHYMHLELLWTAWMPLTLLAMHRAIDRGSLAAGLASGGLFAAQTMSSIYYGVFFGTVLVVFAAVMTIGRTRPAARRAAVSLGCGALLAAVLVAAYFVPYWHARSVVGERSTDEALMYSAGPVHYLASMPEGWLYGSISGRLGRSEKRLFPGAIALLLAAVALWPPVDRHRAAYALALVVAVDLSFGPRGLTYDWLREYVPPYRGLRAPARAAGVALLMIAVLAGFGWARVQRAMHRSRLSRRGAAIAAAGLAAIAAEYAVAPRALIDAPTAPEPVYTWLASRPAGVVAEFPMPDEHALPGRDPEFAYRSTFHWRPLVNGYSGHVPDSYVDLLRAVAVFPSDAALERLRASDVRYIVLHERLFGPDWHRVVADLDLRSGLVRHGPFGAPGHAAWVYEMAAAARP